MNIQEEEKKCQKLEYKKLSPCKFFKKINFLKKQNPIKNTKQNYRLIINKSNRSIINNSNILKKLRKKSFSSVSIPIIANRNNSLLFSAKKTNKIYELNMSNYLYNDSKILCKEKKLTPSTSSKNISEQADISFKFENKLFKNPSTCLNTLLNNKNIYYSFISNKIKKDEKSLLPLLNNTTRQKKIKIKIRNIIPATKNKIDDSNSDLGKIETQNVRKSIIFDPNKTKSSLSTLPLFLEINKHFKSNKNIFYLKNDWSYPVKNFPSSRQEFVFTQENNTFILHGGYGSKKDNNIWIFDPFLFTWNTMKILGKNADFRHSHTGILKNNKFYIFGGTRYIYEKFNNIIYTFEKLCDLEIFDLNLKKWINTENINSGNLSITIRKNHTACDVGEHMYIYGGIDENEKYLIDDYLFNYDELKWEKPKIISKNNPHTLAYHNCCLVVPLDIKTDPKFNIYKIPEKNKPINRNIKEWGIYFFGGKNSENELNNCLYILKIGQCPLEWIIPKTFGIKPFVRYNSSMSFYEKGNFIIIHGGMNEYNVFNDTHILDLNNFNWIHVEYFNKSKNVDCRLGHQSVVFENSLIIFGGINGENYLSSEFFIIDLDSHEACLKELIEDQIKKEVKVNK